MKEWPKWKDFPALTKRQLFLWTSFFSLFKHLVNYEMPVDFVLGMVDFQGDSIQFTRSSNVRFLLVESSLFYRAFQFFFRRSICTFY